MKKTVFLSIIAMGLLFTGCAQVSPTPSKNNVMDANHIDGDTITMDEGGIDEWIDTGIPAEGYGVPQKHNSSKNGFKSLYFGFDKYTITDEMYSVINENVENAMKTVGKIKVEGNCDSFGTTEYNYALGLKRAKAVKDVMVQNGVDSSRIVMVSMGESNPNCETLDEKCMNSNRRADLQIVQ